MSIKPWQLQYSLVKEFGAQRKIVEEHIAKLDSDVRTIGKVGRVNLHKVNEVAGCIEKLRVELVSFIEYVAKEHGLNPDEIVRESSDEIVSALSLILNGRVNKKPSEEQLAEDRKEGMRRVEAGIPPGHADAGKEGDQAANDYLWWAEAVRHSSILKPVAMLLLTNDVRKGDWTYDKRGTRIGLHPFLVKELNFASGALVVHATTDEFLSEAARRLSVSVSSDTVLEAKDLRLIPIEEVVKALRNALGTSLRPMRGATLSGIALGLDPTLKSRDWNGHGTFRQFIQKEVPGVEFDPFPKPGFFYIPGVHELRGDEEVDLSDPE